MDTNCKAYILTAIDKVTGLLHGYYSKGDTYPQTTACIWYAKFYMANGQGVKNALDNLTKRMSYDIRTGHYLSWKVQEVSMNAPKDI